jgi:hypothetical protein
MVKMIVGQVMNEECDFSNYAAYVQLGIANYGIPDVIERVEKIDETGRNVVLYGDNRFPSSIFDGIYQSELLYMINEMDLPIFGAVLHPVERRHNYHDFVNLIKSMNRESSGFFAVENSCRVVGKKIPKFYIKEPFEIQYYLDSGMPLFLDVMALFITCSFSTKLLIRSMEHLEGNIIGYHLMNMSSPINGQFKVVNSLRDGIIDYEEVAKHLDSNIFFSFEVRGKENFERELEWLKEKMRSKGT